MSILNHEEPTEREESLYRENEALEKENDRLRTDNLRLIKKIENAKSLIKQQLNNPVPSLIAIRDAYSLL